MRKEGLASFPEFKGPISSLSEVESMSDQKPKFRVMLKAFNESLIANYLVTKSKWWAETMMPTYLIQLVCHFAVFEQIDYANIFS